MKRFRKYAEGLLWKFVIPNDINRASKIPCLVGWQQLINIITDFYQEVINVVLHIFKCKIWHIYM